ncbi:hypothetical protein ALI144C_41735 [Actinosynnema sp. ALI-1.44]|uniref:hypothetical protein n=1 Tax=Actinosynnema sp. ALI-1.44 TaxID=1933779 RepID=UPI0009C4F566|nr:hypothetical protein [Actinosynnema sp. ALI-1.44]ONI75256.1 hypothetical protein ALI144C_41735 [Actinosynnema sp. ALI-1.44]
MTEPVQRPKRPGVLIGALIVLPLAALLFSMTATNLGGPGSSTTTPPSAALLFALLAIRFSWARAVSTVFLALSAFQWLPGAIEHVGDSRTGQEAIYVLIGAVLFVVGAVMVYAPQSNDYYGSVARWRHARKHQQPT